MHDSTRALNNYSDSQLDNSGFVIKLLNVDLLYHGRLKVPCNEKRKLPIEKDRSVTASWEMVTGRDKREHTCCEEEDKERRKYQYVDYVKI